MAETKVQGVQRGQSLGEQAEGRLRAAAGVSSPATPDFSTRGIFFIFSKDFLGTSEVCLNYISVWDKILSVLPLQLSRGGRGSVTPPPAPAVWAQRILPNQKALVGVFFRNFAASHNRKFPISSHLLEARRGLDWGNVPRQVSPATVWQQAKPLLPTGRNTTRAGFWTPTHLGRAPCPGWCPGGFLPSSLPPKLCLSLS